MLKFHLNILVRNKLIRKLSILQTKAHSQKKGMLRENAQDSLKARSCHEARREESYNNHSQEREKLQKDIINKQIERILSQYESDEDLVKIRNHQPQKKNEIQQLEQKIKQLETSALEKSMLVRQKKLELKTLQRKIREKIIDIKQAKVLKKLKESQKNLKRVSKLRKTRNGKNKIQVDSESYMFKSDRGNDSHRSKETPLTLSHSEITPIKVLLTHKADKKKPKRVTPLPDLKRIKRNLIMKAYRPLTEYSYKLNEHRIQSIKMKGGCENEQKINKNEHQSNTSDLIVRENLLDRADSLITTIGPKPAEDRKTNVKITDLEASVDVHRLKESKSVKPRRMPFLHIYNQNIKLP